MSAPAMCTEEPETEEDAAGKIILRLCPSRCGSGATVIMAAVDEAGDPDDDLLRSTCRALAGHGFRLAGRVGRDTVEVWKLGAHEFGDIDDPLWLVSIVLQAGCGLDVEVAE